MLSVAGFASIFVMRRHAECLSSCVVLPFVHHASRWTLLTIVDALIIAVHWQLQH